MVNTQWFAQWHSRRILYFLFLFISFKSFSQSATASLDRDKILLGEQVTLQFNVNNINDAASFVAAWPQLIDTVNHTEILKHSSIDTVSVNGRITYQQSFTLTSFDSGNWLLGPFVFVLQDRASGKKTPVKTQPVQLTVLPVDVSSMKDYHPIKEIIDVKTSFDWTPFIIAAIAVLLAAVIFIIIKNRKKKKIGTPKIILKGTPLERALEKLYALEKQPLASAGEIKEFHLEADIITRQYFEEMMHIKALHLTAAELFDRLQVYLQEPSLRSKFQQVFEMNASVKFAKYMPQADESKNTLKEIIAGLQQINESVNLPKSNADKLVSTY
ncbi:MAG TPA: BatD family protein [Parafilimonas sp.]|nr:BatD family protein [Parafilimonas sp.]